MKLYHASNCIIDTPDVYHSRDLLDFGKGFYLTALEEQARKYSQRFLFRGDKAFLNHYKKLFCCFQIVSFILFFHSFKSTYHFI